MTIDKYTIAQGFKITIGGRTIAPSDIDIMCTPKQKETLLKNKTIKLKKEVKNDREQSTES